jgi:hypothetical protein
MASRDFGFTTLRNFTAYLPDGSRVPNDYILTISSGGGGKFSNIINPSTVNANLINANVINANTLDVDILSTSLHIVDNIVVSTLIATDYIESPNISSLLLTTSTLKSNNVFTTILEATDTETTSLQVDLSAIIGQNLTVANDLTVYGNFNGSIHYISSLNASTINVSTLNVADKITCSSIFTNLVSSHNIRTNYISTFGFLVFIDNNNSTVTIDSSGQDLLVNGFPLITEGNISSLSSLYWEDDLGTGTLVGGIFNKNLGQGPEKYMVGVGTIADLRGSLSVKYNGGDNPGNAFHISSNNNFLFVKSDNQSPGVNGIDLRIQENQNTDFAASLHFIKTKNFTATDPTSELGYISFYGTNDVQSTVRGGFIMGRQSGIASTFTPMDLQFYTNTSSFGAVNPRMVINKDGNVGIGTGGSGPFIRLHTRVNEQTGLDGIAAQSSDVNTIIGAYSIGSYSGANFGSIQTTHNGNAFDTWPLALNPRGGDVYIGSSISDCFVLSNTINVSTLVASANVGVGIQNPQFPLDVLGNGHFSTTGGLIMLEPDGNTTGNIIRYGGGGPVANNLIFQGAGSFEHMRINPSGYVGIGTNSPAYLLDINGNTNVEFGLNVNSGGANIRGITNIISSVENGWPSLNIVNQGTNNTAAELSLFNAKGGYGLYANGEGSPGGLIASTFQIYSYYPPNNANGIFTLYPNGNLSLAGNLNVAGSAISRVNCTTITSDPGNNLSNWNQYIGKYTFVNGVSVPNLTLPTGSGNVPADGTIIVVRNYGSNNIAVAGTADSTGASVLADKTVSYVFTIVTGAGGGVGGWYAL